MATKSYTPVRKAPAKKASAKRKKAPKLAPAGRAFQARNSTGVLHEDRNLASLLKLIGPDLEAGQAWTITTVATG